MSRLVRRLQLQHSRVGNPLLFLGLDVLDAKLAVVRKRNEDLELRNLLSTQLESSRKEADVLKLPLARAFLSP